MEWTKDEAKTFDVIECCKEQVRGAKYKPTAIFMQINGRVIDILAPENKDEVDKYLEIE